MKAAVLEKVGELILRDVPVPQPGPEEVLIRVKACGICGTDIKLYHGDYEAKCPVILGHEFSGEVAAVGKDVTGISEGDLVAVDPNESCGVCDWCWARQPMFCKSLAGYGVLRDGAFAEYIVVGHKGVFAVPDGLPLNSAAMSEPVSCAVHAVDRADPQPGESVAVIGGGLQGQLMIQMFAKKELSDLITIDILAEKLDMAKRFGATGLISAREKPVEQLMERTKGRGVDIVVEAVGKPECFEMAFELVASTGKVVIFGISPKEASATIRPFDLLTRELNVLGTWCNPYTFDRALALLAGGEVDVQPLISKTLSLQEIMEGFELMEKSPPGFMKAVVIP